MASAIRLSSVTGSASSAAWAARAGLESEMGAVLAKMDSRWD